MNLLNDDELSGNAKILVDTDSLKHVHPFGLDVLRSRLHGNKLKEVPLVFTGKATEYLLYALEIAPHYREAQQLLLEIVR